MSEDRSLDEFAPGDATDAGNGDEAVDADSAVAEGDADQTAEGDGDFERAVDGDAVEPATSTSTWHADGADCDRCGESVERRWRDGDAFVCADCVSW